MKKGLFVSFLSIVLIFTCLLCGVSGMKDSVNIIPDIPDTSESTEPAQESTAPVIEILKPLQISAGEAEIITLSRAEGMSVLSFESSNDRVAAVDDGGRVDALAEGKATITAELKGNKRLECAVTVVKAKEDKANKFSTAITANFDILSKNLKSYNSGSGKNPYSIFVNRKMNCVTIYTYDENGEYTIPVRAMICSCGENNGTITGDFGIYFKNEWHSLYNNVYGHYVSGISGDYLFHSVPYYSPKSDELEVEEFNKLGQAASLGCVRLSISDTKWIYKHCSLNTSVKIYDDDNPGPLGKPAAIKITNKKCGWDPTDDNHKNPYNKLTPQIKGAEDKTVSAGDRLDLRDGVTALDTCSNDITEKMTIVGNVDTSRAGTYRVTYSVRDVLHRTADKTITITVKGE